LKKEIKIKDQDFCITSLKESDLNRILNLTKNIENEMRKKGKSHFLLHRDKQYFVDILQNPNDIVCGVFHKDVLIGKACYHRLQTKEEIERRYPKSDYDFSGFSVGVFSSVCIVEEFRGLGLLGYMDDFIQSCENFDYSIATAKVDNIPSLHAFAKKKYKVLKQVISPVDNEEICLLIRKNN